MKSRALFHVWISGDCRHVVPVPERLGSNLHLELVAGLRMTLEMSDGKWSTDSSDWLVDSCNTIHVSPRYIDPPDIDGHWHVWSSHGPQKRYRFDMEGGFVCIHFGGDLASDQWRFLVLGIYESMDGAISDALMAVHHFTATV